MTDNLRLVFDLSTCTIDSVLSHFNARPGTIEHTALSFAFKALCGGIGNPNHMTTRREAIEIMKEEITFRLDLYREFKNDFFKDIPDYDEDALCAAVICDDAIIHANEALESTEEEMAMGAPVRYRDDGFDPAMLHIAQYIWEQAIDLEGQGLPEEGETPLAESLFLAHINAMQSLMDLEKNISELDPEQSIERIQMDFEMIKTFIRPKTEIGRHLLGFVNSLKKILEPQPPRPPKSRGHLRLV